jgi:hypothetical protein
MRFAATIGHLIVLAFLAAALAIVGPLSPRVGGPRS